MSTDSQPEICLVETHTLIACARVSRYKLDDEDGRSVQWAKCTDTVVTPGLTRTGEAIRPIHHPVMWYRREDGSIWEGDLNKSAPVSDTQMVFMLNDGQGSPWEKGGTSDRRYITSGTLFSPGHCLKYFTPETESGGPSEQASTRPPDPEASNANSSGQDSSDGISGEKS